MSGIDAILSYLNLVLSESSEKYSKSAALPHDNVLFYSRGEVQTNAAQWNARVSYCNVNYVF